MLNYAQMKEYVYKRLKELASKEDLITYGDLLHEMGINEQESWEEGQHKKLRDILGEISSEEHKKGNPLLSALVIHKEGDQLPGKGFFVGLFEEIGRKPILDPEERLRVWLLEIKKLYKEWKQKNEEH